MTIGILLTLPISLDASGAGEYHNPWDSSIRHGKTLRKEKPKRMQAHLRRTRQGQISFLHFSLLLALLIVVGCSARKPSEHESSPGDLIVLGRENVQDQDFERARAAFNKILQEYPESNLRSEALLSLADSFFASKDYQEAKFQYEKFVQLYPVNPQTPRAIYYLSMCDYRRLAHIDRDQTHAEDSLKNFQKLVHQFPDSPLTPEVIPKISELKARLARKEFNIGKFHYSNSTYQAAIPRFLGILKKYPKTPSVDATLYYLADAYKREEDYTKTADALRKLLREYPESRYLERAKKLYSRLPDIVKKEPMGGRILTKVSMPPEREVSNKSWIDYLMFWKN